jgi:thiamine-monophosphate kinase
MTHPGHAPTAATVADAGEHALIALIRARLPQAPPWVLVGAGDDAAVVETERNRPDVFTMDALVDGVHFDRRFTPPAAIGHRALAANLSDLAAMGAEPRLALLSLALPADLPVADLAAMVDGLLALAALHQVHLVGGNITRTPGPLIVDITAIGSIHRRRILTRSGARPGDEVWVSGTVGAAAAGLSWLAAGGGAEGGVLAEAVSAYLRPQPRLRLGVLLGRNRAATSCVDLSDGLADGLTQLASASGVGINVDADALPIPRAVHDWVAGRGGDPVQAALSGGDDYELLFTASPRRRGRLRGVIRLLNGLPVTKIGVVTDGGGVGLRRDGALCAVSGGYEHFS